MSTGPLLAKRHALGLPAGSVRAAHVLGVVGIVGAIILIPPRGETPVAIPPYLVYLLFLMVGHYFAAHGVTIATREDPSPSPLYLPGGVVRFFISIALIACIGWKLYDDPEMLEKQFEASLRQLQEQALLPLVILGSFLLGALVRGVIRHRRSPVFEDVEAWFSLIALVGLTVAALLHIFVLGRFETPVPMPLTEAILGGVIAFYFGERS